VAASAFIRRVFPSVPAVRLYALGLAINMAYLAVLLSFDISRRNLQPVSTSEIQTVWRLPDAGTYVRAARAFLQTGVFAGSDGLPDAHRTVGYPAFLAVAMKLGRDHWAAWLWVLQAVLFAGVYPALAVVAREWFGATERQIRCLLLA